MQNIDFLCRRRPIAAVAARERLELVIRAQPGNAIAGIIGGRDIAPGRRMALPEHQGWFVIERVAVIVQLVMANADINSQRQWVLPSALGFLNTVRTERFDQVLALGPLLPAIVKAA